MTPLTLDMMNEADLADLSTASSQVLLRAVRDAIVEGRLQAPCEPPSPQLARRLQAYRQDFNCDVYVLASTRDQISVLVAPRDDLPLFFLRFDAMASVQQTGPSQ